MDVLSTHHKNKKLGTSGSGLVIYTKKNQVNLGLKFLWKILLHNHKIIHGAYLASKYETVITSPEGMDARCVIIVNLPANWFYWLKFVHFWQLCIKNFEFAGNGLFGKSTKADKMSCKKTSSYPSYLCLWLSSVLKKLTSRGDDGILA